MEHAEYTTLYTSYLTVDEVAETLRISAPTVRAMCEQGRFKGAIKCGAQWRIPVRFADDREP